ncbi:MAG: helix-turn-helix transcriptional regulator, partial [Sphingopyxis sp.]
MTLIQRRSPKRPHRQRNAIAPAAAIRQIHGPPAHPWTVAELAKKAALSRSAFFDRFARTQGVPPMEYLQGWRMSLAKDLLRRREGKLDEIAERVGYG